MRARNLRRLLLGACFAVLAGPLGCAGMRLRSARERVAITEDVEGTIRRLAPREAAWTLGDAGTTPMTQWLAEQGKTTTEEEAQP